MRNDLKQTLFVLFLAGDTVARPRNCFESLLVYFFMAIDALPEFIVLNSAQGLIDQLKNGAIRVGLPKQEFLGVRVGSLVREIDRRVIVSLASFLLGASYVPQKLFTAGSKFLFVIFRSLFIHA